MHVMLGIASCPPVQMPWSGLTHIQKHDYIPKEIASPRRTGEEKYQITLESGTRRIRCSPIRAELSSVNFGFHISQGSLVTQGSLLTQGSHKFVTGDLCIERETVLFSLPTIVSPKISTSAIAAIFGSISLLSFTAIMRIGFYRQSSKNCIIIGPFQKPINLSGGVLIGDQWRFVSGSF